MPKSAQEKMFDFLKERNLTRFNSYDEYVLGTSRSAEIPVEKTEQAEKIGIDLLEEKIAEEKRAERKKAHKEWKDKMPTQERADYDYALGENE